MNFTVSLKKLLLVPLSTESPTGCCTSSGVPGRSNPIEAAAHASHHLQPLQIVMLAVSQFLQVLSFDICFLRELCSMHFAHQEALTSMCSNTM
eukprot:CAMPEP_0178441532 /NCGR_PEP_ID=MMETSP0689_2-20121128/37522_1 /TAXON_ID=160604 /ORGANISM="Amphidinium massartii, Strain CS-259" /LENGTH=92 /DNA_ID=CAMNT_0020064699 /DNA_START=266 /DNA_END=544 /DNA_ORIENTATION=+